jgi:hypothetical protein
MPVRMCVVETNANRDNIEAVGRENVAETDPIGRKVVVEGDADYPSDAEMQQFTAGVADPGAVFLRNNGALFTILDGVDAQNDTVVDFSFASAADDQG